MSNYKPGYLECLQGHNVEKVYIARVLGVFPAEPVTVDVALSWDPKDNHVIAVPDGPRVSAYSDSPEPSHSSHLSQPTGKRQHGGAALELSKAELTQSSCGKRQKQGVGLESSVAGVALEAQEILDGASGQAAAAETKCRSHAGAHNNIESKAQPKAALTSFRRLAVSPDQRTSIVECRSAHKLTMLAKYAP